MSNEAARPALSIGCSYGRTIRSDQLRVGDLVALKAPVPDRGEYDGLDQLPIVRLGPKNIMLHYEYDYGPVVGVRASDVRIPRSDVIFAARGKIVHPVVPRTSKKRSRSRF